MAAQKSLLFLALMVVITISGCASAPTRREVLLEATGYRGARTEQSSVSAATIAQEKTTSAVAHTLTGCNGTGSDRFLTMSACIATMSSGVCAYYTPKKTTREKEGEAPYDVVPLEGDACVSLSIEGGNVAIVPQRKGTNYRSRNGVLFARNDCGNHAGEIYIFPPPAPAQGQQAPAPALATAPAYSQNICEAQGYSGNQYFPGFNPDGTEQCFFRQKKWYDSAWAQYPICTLLGAGVGFKNGGVNGALNGGGGAIAGVALGREVGSDSWGWVGCVTGPAVGLLSKKPAQQTTTSSTTSSSGSPANPGGTGSNPVNPGGTGTSPVNPGGTN